MSKSLCRMAWSSVVLILLYRRSANSRVVDETTDGKLLMKSRNKRGPKMSRCPTTIKAQCYTTLVRPTLEYASSIWSPSKKDSINKVEAVQRRAARFATGDYQHTSSVSHATASPLADTTKQTSICADSDDVPHSVQPCWYTSRTPPQPHLPSNQRPFTTIPGTTHKNYSAQDNILPTSHTPLEPTTWKCGGNRHPRQLQDSAI
jgi:hypothetical protein